MPKVTSRAWSYLSTGVITVSLIIDVIVAKCLRMYVFSLVATPPGGRCPSFWPYCCNLRPIQGSSLRRVLTGRTAVRGLENDALRPAPTSGALSPPEALPGERLSGESRVSDLADLPPIGHLEIHPHPSSSLVSPAPYQDPALTPSFPLWGQLVASLYARYGGAPTPPSLCPP